MSNFLAIATVTETLRQILDGVVKNDVTGAIATALRPNSSSGLPDPGVNIYLYQVTPNSAWRNEDLPTRRSGGELAQRPRAAIDLHYLLSFYGDENELKPQRVLGSVIRTLHEQPMLSRQKIRSAISSQPYLADSNLDQEIELMKFTPTPFSLEELSKLWSVLFQTSYALSVAYHGTVVLIESQSTPQATLPVRERNLYTVPFRHPVIEQVMSQAGENQPITAGSTLLILGKQLRGEITRVKIGEDELEPQQISDTQISLQLSIPPVTLLRAGIQGVQVVHKMQMGTPETEHRGFESNVAAFVLRPTIASTSASNTQVTLQINPALRKGQRVVLLLNERSDTAPAAYTFVAPSPAADSNSIQITIKAVKAAKYFVRLQVDGAESPLDLDTTSPTFGPTVTIP